jgi:hypothetical protein
MELIRRRCVKKLNTKPLQEFFLKKAQLWKAGDVEAIPGRFTAFIGENIWDFLLNLVREC